MVLVGFMGFIGFRSPFKEDLLLVLISTNALHH